MPIRWTEYSLGSNQGRFPWTGAGESRRIRSQIAAHSNGSAQRIQNGSHKNIKRRDEIRVSSRFFTTKRFTVRLILPFNSMTYRDVHFMSVNATDFLSLKKLNVCAIWMTNLQRFISLL